MLQTIEAIIEKEGVVRLLEPIHPTQSMRVLITLLEPIETNTSRMSMPLYNSPKLAETQLDEVAGCLAYKGKAKTLEEMDDAIAKGIKAQNQ